MGWYNADLDPVSPNMGISGDQAVEATYDGINTIINAYIEEWGEGPTVDELLAHIAWVFHTGQEPMDKIKITCPASLRGVVVQYHDGYLRLTDTKFRNYHYHDTDDDD